MSLLHTSEIPTAVLDTNVVLDLLVFADRWCDVLRQAIDTQCLQWVATPSMKNEWTAVLLRGSFMAWQPDVEALSAVWTRHCSLQAEPPPHAPTSRYRCTDADDQKFIDLAIASKARWLLTRDRTVLKLAAALRRLGIEVTTPKDWSAKFDVN